MHQTTIKTTGLRIAKLSLLSATLIACSSSGQTPELRDARSAYNDAASNDAAKRVPQDLQAARTALDRAEQAHTEDPGSVREADLAKIAQHKAEIANAHANLVEAQSETAAAKQKAREEVAEAEHEAAEEKAEARADARKTERDLADDKAAARADARKAERELAEDKASYDARHARSTTAARTQPAKRVESEPSEHGALEAHESVQVRPAKPATDLRSDAALQNLAHVASVKQEPRGIVITLSGSLLFPTGKTELTPIARQSLDQVADAVAQQPKESKLAIAGHTDDSGSKEQNARLSTARAKAVAEHLEQRGIGAERIQVVGYGEANPIASNDNEQGRALNRRVEIVIARPGTDPLASK